MLKNTADLKSNACVAPAKPIPAFIRHALKKVHPDVTARSLDCYTVASELFTLQQSLIHRWLQWVSSSLRYYGCGLVVPECLEGCRILDLGSGSGRDCYMLSQLVGGKGHVTGIDMTEDQVLYISITVWLWCTVNCH